jgi:hypothetical protein
MFLECINQVLKIWSTALLHMEVAGEFGSPDRGDCESEFPMLLRKYCIRRIF